MHSMDPEKEESINSENGFHGRVGRMWIWSDSRFLAFSLVAVPSTQREVRGKGSGLGEM